MGSNSFGNIFKMTTWGESHGKAIGVVIDGCPASVQLNEQMLNEELSWRSPGRHSFISPRKEPDHAEILSGTYEEKTTGAPISIIIWNCDAQSQHYAPLMNLLRPGHANYTFLKKYGCYDPRGGGRASARETACRVAAGAVAKKILSDVGIVVVAYVKSIGTLQEEFTLSDVALGVDFALHPHHLKEKVKESALFCPDIRMTKKMEEALTAAIKDGDSLGGVIEAIAFNVPVGWGDPVYEKLEANLAKAMLSIPASKGFEIGEGFNAARFKGSEHNDLFCSEERKIILASNHAGGTLGGISNGMPIVIRVPFKPTSSIKKEQTTVDLNGESQTFVQPEGARHDPCVAIRAAPVVEAMFALVLVDAMLMQRSSSMRHLA